MPVGVKSARVRSIFVDEGGCRSLRFTRMSNRMIILFEAVMLRLVNVNSQSEHDLYIQLFLTGGGGW